MDILNKSTKALLSIMAEKVDIIKARRNSINYVEFGNIDNWFKCIGETMNKSKIECGSHETMVIAGNRVLAEWDHQVFGWIKDCRKGKRAA